MTEQTEPATPPRDFRSIIAAAKLPERVIPLCLRGDLVARVDELEAKLREIRPSERMVPSPERVETAQAIADLQTEMRESTIDFRLRAMPRQEFRKHIANHPPREDNPLDQHAGFNTDTYFFALVERCLVEPDMTADEFANLVDNVLSSGQWKRLTDAAAALNMDDVAVPFSSAASILLRKSGETSKPPPAGESPSSGSTAGNP